jgi:hypothetical protein
MDNSEKLILDLCGGTGAWSRPYVEAGYDVQVVTLPYYPLFDSEPGDVRFYGLPAKRIYGILAACPCTEFSLAKQNTERNFEKGLEIVEAVKRLIWQARLKHKLQFWAIENPKGYLRQFLGKAPYEFEQWEFGDNGIKPTEIWGYFNFPRKTVTEKPKCEYLKNVQAVNGLNRQAIRAITPAGFANAFFKVNK